MGDRPLLYPKLAKFQSGRATAYKVSKTAVVVLMLTETVAERNQEYVESRMPLQTARTGSEGGVRVTQSNWAIGPYLTISQVKWL